MQSPRPIKNMATTARAYPNSSGPQSAKVGQILSAPQIVALIEKADFSERRPAKIRCKVGGKWTTRAGSRLYRRFHVNRFVLAVWKGAHRPTGPKDRIYCFAGVGEYQKQAHLSERATQYKLKEVREKYRLLEETTEQSADTRSTRTYKFHVSRLRKPTPINHGHRSPVPSPAAPPVPQPSRHAANSFAKPLRAHRAVKLTDCIGRLMMGSPQLAPIREQGKAIAKAAGLLSMRLQDAEQHLRDCPWNFEDWKIAQSILAAETPKGECDRHFGNGLTQWGTCWSCYAERGQSTNNDP